MKKLEEKNIVSRFAHVGGGGSSLLINKQMRGKGRSQKKID